MLILSENTNEQTKDFAHFKQVKQTNKRTDLQTNKLNMLLILNKKTNEQKNRQTNKQTKHVADFQTRKQRNKLMPPKQLIYFQTRNKRNSLRRRGREI